MKHIHAAAILAALSLAALPALAGVKYWDNPDFKAFDVGDYVQDGLVVNYDGIRNQGPNADHDPNAMTWVNSANPGTYDATRYSTNGTVGASNAATPAAWNNDAARGAWTDKGFVFDKDAAFHQPSSFAIPKTYTIQSLVDATPVDQPAIGYIMCDYNAAHWAYCSLGIRNSNYNYGGGNVANTMYLVSGSIGKRPAVRGASGAPFTYVTAINNANDGVTFTGTKAPWDAASTDASYGHAYNSSTAGSAYTYANGFCIGSHYPRTDEMFKGTIKNFRFYNRCLSDAEVLWNRVVDDARYFRGVRDISVIPATNVVESFTIPGARDFHYAIDAEGQTFTAPASKAAAGKRYVCSGYTLETWDGSAWGVPVAHNGEFSYTAADTSALVRVTWQYAEASGEGGLKVYGVGDYVQDGLVWNYDGICNQGADVPHDPTALTWANLGSGGSSTDLYLQRRNTAGNGYENATELETSGGRNAGPGAWTADGFAFQGESRFRSDAPISAGTNYTIQTLVDVKTEEQLFDVSYFLSASWNNFAFAFRKTGSSPKPQSLYWNHMGATYRTYIYNDSHEYDYATAIMNGETKTAAFFAGTKAPTSGGVADGFHQYDAVTPFSGTGYNIGGYGSADGQMSGVLKFMRFYNRSLTDAEVAHNRRVDNYRYFGILEPEATNVVVQSTYSYLQGNEKAGPYEVEGSYTFTAPETVTAPNGITYACDGYILETQDGIGWALVGSYESCSYLYNASAGTVRLTWKWKATSGLRTAADYSFDDLSPAGLALHYDGLLNQGVGVARSTTSTKWVNLGSRPGMDLTRKNYTGFSPSWGEKGHVFPGRSMFESSTSVPWPTTFSAQVLVDAQFSDNTHQSGNYIAATTWNQFGMQIDGSRKVGRFNAQGTDDYTKRANYSTATGIDYMTAIHDAATQTAVVFPGMKAPTGGSVTDGYMHFGTFNGLGNNKFRLGGWGGGTDVQCLVGTIYTFRYYDRVLTEEELVRNRNVDSVRYFGALAVTNLVVEVSDDSVVNAVPAAGAYFVEGSYEFQATQRQNVPLAYRIQTWDEANGRWVTTDIGEGGSYTHVVTDPLAKTRILWREIKPFIIIVR